MSLSVTRGALTDGAKKLRAAWLSARRDWDDEQARWFEATFLEPLGPKLKSAVDAIETLKAELERAERETRPD